jgi:hypothetical protein
MIFSRERRSSFVDLPKVKAGVREPLFPVVLDDPASETHNPESNRPLKLQRTSVP